MSYFIKETHRKGDLYYQIYEGHYDKSKGYSVQTSYKVLGYLSDLKTQGIDNPKEYFKEEVNRLNLQEKENKKAKRFETIKDTSLKRYVGYFPAKDVLEKLEVRKDLDLFNEVTGFRFSLYEMLCALIFSRLVCPCSKKATFESVMPNLYTEYCFSYDQILEACGYYGIQYEKIVDIFTHRVKEKYGLDTSRTYFDCTNFYFEIDREDDFRRKGPSKENRHDPIVGLGLLLDRNMIPINMTLYPGNESEKPYIRKAIDKMKTGLGVKGRTVQVADKGLNCAENIYEAMGYEDGYIFSRSVKKLNAKEEAWVFKEDDVWTKSPSGKYSYKDCEDTFEYSFKDDQGKEIKFSVREKRVVTFSPVLKAKQKREIDRLVAEARAKTLSKAKRSEFGDAAKFVKFVARNNEDVTAKPVINHAAVEEAYKYCGYNMLVTSETDMDSLEIYRVYHNLWRIEETFRAMKTDLETRPVFLQKESTIKGHFLICYLAILIVRLIQFKELNDEFCTNDVINFMRKFIVVRDPSGSDYLNIGEYNKLYDRYNEKYGIMLHLFKLKSRDFKTLGL